MTDEQIKQLISDTVSSTVRQLQSAGLLKDPEISAYKKTEELLRQYPRLKNLGTPYARQVVQQIDACLEEYSNDPYLDVIHLFYFGGLKNAACASVLCCNERTCRRARRKLVQEFSVRLASDEFIKELFSMT